MIDVNGISDLAPGDQVWLRSNLERETPYDIGAIAWEGKEHIFVGIKMVCSDKSFSSMYRWYPRHQVATKEERREALLKLINES